MVFNVLSYKSRHVSGCRTTNSSVQANLYTTTRSSSFRATPRRNASDSDTTDGATSAVTPPDGSVFPPKYVDDQQSSWTGVVNFADLDGHVNPRPCNIADVGDLRQ